MFNKLKSWPTLFSETKTGKVQEWNVSVTNTEKGDGFYIQTVWGEMNGKKQLTKKLITDGKNIGKSNETTAYQQACYDAESMWNKKKLSNYREDLEQEKTILPMLAHKYNDKNIDKIQWPCSVQPKLNGVRCLAKRKDGKILFTSRQGKKYETLKHIEEQLLKVMEEGQTFDGEVFDEDLDFQEIIKRVKRVKSKRDSLDDVKVKYWIYDIVDEDLTFEERFKVLNDLLLKYSNVESNQILDNLVLTPTFTCYGLEQVLEYHQKHTLAGFEGTMIRNNKSKYLIEYRSYDLLKLKDFQDKEFEIVGGIEGTGKDTGTIIFTVKNDDGKEFNVRPKGTFQQRSEWWKTLDKLIGKKLTVKFQEYSQDGIPIFPVGECIRDFE